MKVIFDSQEFSDRTKPVQDEFDFIEIKPDTLLGHFLSHRLSELIAYCTKYPQFHIVSGLKYGAGKMNRPIDDAAFYLLAQGDANPSLIHSTIKHDKQFETLKICEFLSCSRLT